MQTLLYHGVEIYKGSSLTSFISQSKQYDISWLREMRSYKGCYPKNKTHQLKG